MTRRTTSVWALILAALVLTACSDEATTPEEAALPDPADSEAPLSDLDALLEGTPDSDKLPSEAKSDEVFPSSFDLVDMQSPVKSQGSRGVCSIFSTVALMEHLYIKEGTITDPDFSEQFLQWSAKFEARRFRNTGGSNASSNLEAISRFGIVDEIAWPYESSPWGASDLEGCGKDEGERPTECFTNGAPGEEVLKNKRWDLPRGRHVSSRVRSIKAVMKNKETAVVSGMTFFYQSWNHRRSQLPTNRDYWAEGYVLSPNDKDREISLEKRAGHSILLVGWNDDLEVPRVDENGDVIKDEDGNPVLEKGFFAFKNSWGTGGFGLKNQFGAGYGWISYDYVEEFGRSMTAETPRLNLAAETCDDGIDNNGDRQIDCEDPKCEQAAACIIDPVEGDLSNNTEVAIPDNDPAGVTSTIEVSDEGFVTDILITLDIEHSFIGDLTVTVTSPDGRESTLHNGTGASADSIKDSFTSAALIGATAKGTWTLKIVDNAASDDGKLIGWSIAMDLSDEVASEVCDDGVDNVGNGLVDCSDPTCADLEACISPESLTVSSAPALDITDNTPEGVKDSINIAAEGKVDAVTVTVDISHTYIGDLEVSLVHPDGTTIVLHDKEGSSDDDILEEYVLEADLQGKDVTGDWSLQVVDTAADDTGTLNEWAMEISLQ